MKMRTLLALATTLGSAQLGCLPTDTRPEPGLVRVSADLVSEFHVDSPRTDPLTFETDDGWTVAINRLFVVMGYLNFDGDGCNAYSVARYGRILDLLQPGPQKIGQNWGLNDCQLGYRVSFPSDDDVLGAGVTEKDRAWMRDATVPVSRPEGLTTAQGMTLHVQGSLAKGTTQVTFDWGFADELNWTECKRRIDGELETRLPLVGGETIQVNIAVDPRNLFRAKLPAPDKATVGDSIALQQLIFEADQVNGNANGRVAIDELLTVQVPGATTGENLGEVLRKYSYTSLFLYAGDGVCIAGTRGRRGPGGHAM